MPSMLDRAYNGVGWQEPHPTARRSAIFDGSGPPPLISLAPTVFGEDRPNDCSLDSTHVPAPSRETLPAEGGSRLREPSLHLYRVWPPRSPAFQCTGEHRSAERRRRSLSGAQLSSASGGLLRCFADRRDSPSVECAAGGRATFITSSITQKPGSCFSRLSLFRPLIPFEGNYSVKCSSWSSIVRGIRRLAEQAKL